MRKIFVALLVGLLLVGIGAATGGHNHHVKPGEAKSCAVALAGAGAFVDKHLIAAQSGTDGLVVYSNVKSNTFQIDDAKADPVSASLSTGSAQAGIWGDIKVDDRHHGGHGRCNDCDNDVAKVAVVAGSESTAFNAAMGSEKATGSTFTMNTANVFANECGLGSNSFASSMSTGEAKGISNPDAKEDALVDLAGDIFEVACEGCDLTPAPK